MFSHLFSKGSLGIEITTKYIRFVHLIKKDELMHVKDFGRIVVPQNIFSDGVLKDTDGMKILLKKILKKSNAEETRLTIPVLSQRFFLITLPGYDPKTLSDDIIFHLKEHVLFHHEKDELVEMRVVSKGSHSTTVRVVVVLREEYANFKMALKVFQGTNFHFERGNQAAVLASLQEHTKMPRLHVQFGDDSSSYSVIDNGKVVVYQEFPFSTHHFLLEAEKRITKPGVTAGQYLSQLGIFGADVREFSEDSIKPIAFVLDHAIVEYGRETGKKIQEVSLGGVFGGYKGVSMLFSKQLRLPVVEAYPWKTFDPRFDESIFEMKKSETLEYLSALGLALDGMK